MSNPKRKELSFVQKIDMDKFSYVPLDDVIAYLTALRDETNGDGRLDFEVCETYYDDHHIECDFTHYRIETDEEYEARCKDHHKRAAAAKKAAKTRKAKQEKEERETLAKLRKKYG